MTSPTIDEARDVSLVGYHDLGNRPAFKLALARVDDRWLLYTGSFWHHGWSIVDVSDPEHPEYVRFVEGPSASRTAQIQVAGGTMVTSLERDVYGDTDAYDASLGGAYVWDVAEDPTNPKLLGHYRSGGNGTHRNFYAGGRYIYAAVRGAGPAQPGARPGGYLAIVDIDDPTHPTEVCRWPGEPPDPEWRPFFHGPAYVVGDRAYASFGGMLILDTSDVRAPRAISRVEFGDFGGVMGCHSAVPYPGRQLVVANGEATEEGADMRAKYVAVIDISDEADPKILSTFPYPRPSADASCRSYWTKGGRFGPHNQHHHQGHPDLFEPREHVVMTFFNAGLRIFSIADPHYPQEVAHFVAGEPTRTYGPRPRTGRVSHFEDVLVDSRGYIYCSDATQGLFVLRYDGELA